MATAAVKRRSCEEETKSEVKVHKKKREASIEDRVSDLPEALQLRILALTLASLDAKLAFQTSRQSRTLVSSWTRTPFLNFDCHSFENPSAFNNFVNNVLSRRNHLAKLDKLRFISDHNKKGRTKVLRTVFDYAFSCGVQHIEASIQQLGGHDPSWPVSICDSLTSLKLDSRDTEMKCPFLGPGSKSFKNLTVLHLSGALITDDEPFSGFRLLESLTLLDCNFLTKGNNLRVHALRLVHLTMSGCSRLFSTEFRTPRLRFLKYRGYDFPKHDQGLDTDLETLVIDFRGFYEKRLFEDMLSFFSTLGNVKSLTLFWPTTLLLALFPDELARRSSPFLKLKKLKLDLRVPCRRSFYSPCKDAVKSVKAYLLQHIPDAKCINSTCTGVMEWSADDP